jgi:hypothetical protein
VIHLSRYYRHWLSCSRSGYDPRRTGPGRAAFSCRRYARVGVRYCPSYCFIAHSLNLSLTVFCCCFFFFRIRCKIVKYSIALFVFRIVHVIMECLCPQMNLIFLQDSLSRARMEPLRHSPRPSVQELLFPSFLAYSKSTPRFPWRNTPQNNHSVINKICSCSLSRLTYPIVYCVRHTLPIPRIVSMFPSYFSRVV